MSLTADLRWSSFRTAPRPTYRLRVAFCLALLFAGIPNTRADDGSDTGAAPALPQIVVTATKRPESIDKVPVSVAAYDRASIEKLDLRSLADVAGITPGLLFRPSFEDTSVIAIRGIYSVTGTATTGVYIDDTPLQVRYLGAGQQSTNPYPVLFDLERVEVLRGPQGNLFGAGAEGGIVRFITTPPSLRQTSGHARAAFGVTEDGAPEYEAGVAAGGPLQSDVLGFRFSVYGRQEGGYIDRMPYPGLQITNTNINSSQAAAINGSFSWSPVSDLIVSPGLYYLREHRADTSQYWLTLSNPGAGAFRSGFSIPQPGTDRFALPSLKIQWDLGPVRLFANSSYLDRSRSSIGDYTFILNEALTGNYSLPGNVRAPQTTFFSNPQKAFTEEVRLQSGSEGWLEWTAGAFFHRARQEAHESIYAPTLGDVTQALYGATVPQAFGIGLLPGSVEYFGFDTAHDSQTALFGQADLRIRKDLRLTLGLRVSRLVSKYTNEQGGPLNGGASSGEGEQRETASTPTLTLAYEPGDDWLLYVSGAKGFRPGGGNPPVSPARCAVDLRSLGLTESPPSYRSDSVWSYELGAKHAAPAAGVELSGSLYYIRWRDIQQNVFLPTCGLQFAANLGMAVSKGFDLQLTVAPVSSLPDLTLSASVGYDDARYTRTVYGAQTLSGAPSVIVTEGERLSTAPWQAFMSLDYGVSPAAGYELFAHADYGYSSGYRIGAPADLSYDPIVDDLSQVRLANARFGVRHNRWELSLFARNLGDSHDALWLRRGVVTSQLIQGETFRPRTVGATLNLAF